MVRKIISMAVCIAMLVITFTSTSFAADVYDGTISTSNLQYARDLIQKVDFNENYVFFRSGQYTYDLVVGKDLVFENNKFVSNGEVEIYNYTTSSGYNSGYTYNLKKADSYSLNISDDLVYSNLGYFPSLEERGSTYEIIQTLFIVIVALCVFVRGVFFRR